MVYWTHRCKMHRPNVNKKQLDNHNSVTITRIIEQQEMRVLEALKRTNVTVQQ